jgi:protein dithiol oxidoreductase (disulfide-forming)
MPAHVRSMTRALWLLAATAALTSGPASAQLLEGRDYRTLAPAQPTTSPGKIEVTEFFSYACPHCRVFYPLVSAWAAKLPKDVVFTRVAVSYGRPAWVNLARAYYALDATGDLAKLDGPLFRAIHDEHLNLFDEQSIADWVGKQGGDAARFANAYTSFGVNNQTVQADQAAESYRIEAIPSLAVNGKYVVISPAEAADEEQTFRDLLALTDKVIAKARSESPTAPKATASKAAPATGAAKPR